MGSGGGCARACWLLAAASCSARLAAGVRGLPEVVAPTRTWPTLPRLPALLPSTAAAACPVSACPPRVCRKENQVYTAEEKAALAMFNFEENKRKEQKILEEMRRLVDSTLGQGDEEEAGPPPPPA